MSAAVLLCVYHVPKICAVFMEKYNGSIDVSTGDKAVVAMCCCVRSTFIVPSLTLSWAQHGRLFISCRAGLVWPRTSLEHTGSFAQLL